MEWYGLRTAGVKDRVIRILLKNFENYRDIFEIDKTFLLNRLDIEQEQVDKIYSSRNIDSSEEFKKMEEHGVKLLFIKDEAYPDELKHIAQPPVFLYYKGNIELLKKRKIGIIGTRKATSYGKASCEKIVKGLVENGIATVSGLARGIDGVCHKVTLNNSGHTIAVVGCGLDVIYPKSNEKLWNRVAENGLIISEFPFGTQPLSFNFPLRNRIIAGISRGVVVVESYERGGSLITAELALDEGRDVFAVPGDLFSPCSEGTNNLIKNSLAKLVTNAEDILVEYGWENAESTPTKKLNLTERENKIYNVLVREKNLDEIMHETSMKPGEILSLLMELEVKGVISSVPGGKYRRKV